MFAWLRKLNVEAKKQRLRDLRLGLVTVEAAIASEAEMTRRTNTLYPTVMENNAREAARLKFLIAEIESSAPQ